METIEGNKLIAEFMKHTGRNKLAHEFQKMEGLPEKDYHSSWDWLMPVVEKIEKTNRYNEYYPDMVTIWKDCCKISDGNNGAELFFIISPSKSKIEAVWLAVVEFIEWYNKQK